MTTKTLHIVRHGKALQDYNRIEDFDRPLIEKGILNNITAAKQLRAKYACPQLIISSHAARALHTAHNFAQVMGYPHEKVQVNEKFYLQGENVISDVIEKLPDEIESVMIVGHNPDVTNVASQYAQRYVEYMPTSGIVSIHFKTDRWSEIGKVKTEIVTIF